MRLDLLILGALMFSMTFVAGLFLVADINNNYPTANMTTEEFNSTYNKINEIYNLSQDLKDDMIDNEIEGEDQSWESSVKASYKGVRRGVTGSFSVFGTAINEMAKLIGVPSFVVSIALTALVISVIFGFIFMIFRFKG